MPRKLPGRRHDRGRKLKAIEGGTRLPFICYWPGHIEHGVSDALVCQMDLLSSMADLAGVSKGTYRGTDSEDILDALLGKSANGRDNLVEQSPNALAIRHGPWKYIPAGNRPEIKPLEEGDNSAGPTLSPDDQLYNLDADPGETNNVYTDNPSIAKKLAGLLAQERSKPLAP